MGYIACLNYAFRICLLFFRHLWVFKIMKVESAVVCCHMFLIRLVINSPRQPPGLRLRAVAICVRTPSRLIALMKPSTAARCALANEILRRRYTPVCDKTTRPGLEHRFELMSVFFEHPQTLEKHGKQDRHRATSCTQSLGLKTVGERCNAKTTGVPTTDKTMATASQSTTCAHRVRYLESQANIMPVIVRRANLSMWKPTFSHNRTSCPVLVALQLNTERSTQSLAYKAQSIRTSKSNTDNTCDTLGKRIAQAQYTGHGQEQDPGSFHFPQVNEPTRLGALNPNSYLETLSISPNSDTKLVEEPATSPYNSLEGGVSIQSHGGIPTPTRKPSVRHRRHLPSSSAFDTVRAALDPSRSRSKTSDGLLSFKASPFRGPADKTIRGRHRHKISLNLPVKVQIAQSETSAQRKLPDLSFWAESPHHLQTAPGTAMTSTLTPDERDLEYKHRRTFIGTGSLDDFLELLEVSDTYLTTQNAVVGAFVQLSSAEQIYARQFSTEPDGWELVSRVKLDVMDVASIDYVIQLQVKLGSITLRQFLDMIPFDKNKQAAAMQVVEAFSAASHMDAKTTMGTTTKARWFRSWIVAQKANSEC